MLVREVAEETAELVVLKLANPWVKISEFRRATGMAIDYTGDRTKDGVVALFNAEGFADDFISSNGWIRKELGRGKLSFIKEKLKSFGLRANGNTLTHAEGGSLLRAVESGVKAKKGTLYVDASFCDSCGGSFWGLRTYAEKIGLEELTVYIRLSNGHIVSGLYNLGLK
jgi:hypothetical protein